MSESKNWSFKSIYSKITYTSNKFIPQIKPIIWINISLITYINLYLIIIIINSIPLNINFHIYNKKIDFKKWNWIWY